MTTSCNMVQLTFYEHDAAMGSRFGETAFKHRNVWYCSQHHIISAFYPYAPALGGSTLCRVGILEDRLEQIEAALSSRSGP